jgi:hypothetical protein
MDMAWKRRAGHLRQAGEVVTPTQEPTRAPAKKKRPSTGRDMLISLLVVGVAVGLFVVLLPKTPHAKVTPVEYLPAARELAGDTTLPIYAPQPLPAGWQASYIRFGEAPDAIHIGFVLKADKFARLDESLKPDAAFYTSSHVPTQKAAGPSPLAGYELRRDGGHVALVKYFSNGSVLTMSDGGTASSASLAQLVSLTKSLQLQKR